MDQDNQGQDFGAPSILPAKRRRGRPPKNPNLRQAKTASGPAEGSKGKCPLKANRVDKDDNMVGRPVTGVVETSFDAGYVVNVRVGNSNTTFRGAVFKPGHYVPITAENDVAPNVQMIRRADVRTPARKRTKRCAQGLAVQTPRTVDVSQEVASSVPPLCTEGTVVPVVSQPANTTEEPTTLDPVFSQPVNAADEPLTSGPVMSQPVNIVDELPTSDPIVSQLVNPADEPPNSHPVGQQTSGLVMSQAINSPDRPPTSDPVVAEAVNSPDGLPTLNPVVLQLVNSSDGPPTPKLVCEPVNSSDEPPTPKLVSEPVNSSDEAQTTNVVVSEAVNSSDGLPTSSLIMSQPANSSDEHPISSQM